MRQRIIAHLAKAMHISVGWVLKALKLLTLGQLPAVVGVGAIVLRGGEMLALQRFDGRYALPGGAMRYGETCCESLCREVREETGYQISIDGIVGVYSQLPPGRTVRAVVIIYRCGWEGGQARGSYEGQPVWLELAALPDAARWAFGSDKPIADMIAGRINLC